MEQSSRKRGKRKNITDIVIGTVGLAGLLGVMMVAPNVIGAMGKLGLIPGGRQKEIVNRARDRLIKQGYMRKENGFLRLTPKGKARFDLLRQREAVGQKPLRWDRKWRVLIFDIPEYRRAVRNKMRQTLLGIGFMRLQDSVWIYPYDCEDLIALLKADFKIGKDVLYMIVEELEGDSWIKENFDLH